MDERFGPWPVSLEKTDKLVKVHQQGSAVVFEGVQSDARGGDVNYVRVRGVVKGVKLVHEYVLAA